MIKTIIYYLVLALLILLATPLVAQAKKSDLPSVSSAHKVVKAGAIDGSLTVTLPSNLPGTRHYLIEFNPSDYVVGALAPKNGLEVIVGRNKDTNQNWAIASYFVDGTHLLSRGGIVGDYENWNLVDPSGNPIGGDDPRIELFSQRLAESAKATPITVADNAIASSANPKLYYSSINAAAALSAYVKQVKKCRGRFFILAFFCTDNRHVAFNAAEIWKRNWRFDDDNSKWKLVRVACQAFGCYGFRAEGNDNSRCLGWRDNDNQPDRRGMVWLNYKFKQQYGQMMIAPLYIAARDISRITCG